MRLAKARKSRKHLNFYRATHGFRPPFTVLIDGTALQTALNLGIVLKDELAKLLGGRAEVVVSRAVVAELRALGKDFAGAAAAAQKLKYIASEGAGTAFDSVLALVRGGNPQKLCVLTEDPQLQRRVGGLMGVPLLRFARDRLMLEAPCRAEGTAAHLSAPKPPQKAGRSSEDGPRAPAAEEVAPEQRKRAADPPPQPRKKRRKEPNPLSVKKKKKKLQAGAPPDAQQAAAAEPGAGRRRRKRKRGTDGAPGA